MNVALVTSVENKNSQVLEHYFWYKSIGVSYFYYLKGSHDDGIGCLDFIESIDDDFHVVSDFIPDSKNATFIRYNYLLQALRKNKEIDYVLVLGIDEFLVLKKHETISDLIIDFSSPDVISFQSAFFCSSGFDFYNETPIISRFIRRANDNFYKNRTWRSLWSMSENVKRFGTNRPFYNASQDVSALKWIIPTDKKNNREFDMPLDKRLGGPTNIDSDVFFDFAQVNNYSEKNWEEIFVSENNKCDVNFNKSKSDFTIIDKNSIEDKIACCLLESKRDKFESLKRSFFEFKKESEIKKVNKINFFDDFKDIKVSICFFGITRSLDYTVGSIKENILNPISKLTAVSTFAHFYDLDRVYSERSNEDVLVDSNQFRLLDYDFVSLEKPKKKNDYYIFNELKKHGDAWKNNFSSLGNLILQLNSLKKVVYSVLSEGVDICLFLRPDLTYHDSFKEVMCDVLSSHIETKEDKIYIPDWQHHGGYNDRFAICVGESAVRAYGERIDDALEFCKKRKRALHSESLVKFSLDKYNIKTSFISLKASRTRANGEVVPENFMVKF